MDIKELTILNMHWQKFQRDQGTQCPYRPVPQVARSPEMPLLLPNHKRPLEGALKIGVVALWSHQRRNPNHHLAP